MSKANHYSGRFAPSPTGPLHFGSLVAAVGSYLQARTNQGDWYLRIEDLDPPREVAGATNEILHTLEHYGLHWDGEILYQSQRSHVYQDALKQLIQQGYVYPCGCTRKQIQENAVIGHYGPIYQGCCRQGHNRDTLPSSLRVLTHDSPISFVDSLRGTFKQKLESEIGDFVVRRADKLFAYQLAVVVDDAAQDITEVVRGADLLDNTPRQIHLQKLFNWPTPSYMHLPVALNRNGQKLSKQTGAPKIAGLRPQTILYEVLSFLNQNPAKEIIDCDLDSFWQWAIQNWQPDKIPTSDQHTPALFL